MVRALAGFDGPHDDIAGHIGIDPTTLRRRFRDDLDRGMTEASAKVAQPLFQIATHGKNFSAAKFWIKARGRWHEVHPTADAGVRCRSRPATSTTTDHIWPARGGHSRSIIEAGSPLTNDR